MLFADVSAEGVGLWLQVAAYVVGILGGGFIGVLTILVLLKTLTAKEPKVPLLDQSITRAELDRIMSELRANLGEKLERIEEVQEREAKDLTRVNREVRGLQQELGKYPKLREDQNNG